MSTLRITEARLAEAREVLLRRAEARYPLGVGQTREAPSEPPKPVQVTDTEVVRDAAGRIVGKREITRTEVPSSTREDTKRPLIPFLTPDEMRIVAATPYARRTRPGAIEFDYSVIEDALGRHLWEHDVIVLRSAAVAAEGGELGARLDALTEEISAIT